MSLNKKLLAGTIAGLLISANAGAVVLGVDDAREYARELTKPVDLTDPSDFIEVELGYNFSDGEVRYGRLECTSNVELTPVGVPTVTPGSGDISLGAVNGSGTQALFFSITDDGLNANATENDVITFDFDVTLEDNNNVNCAFSIYDQPSQAQAGGAAGRIATTGFAPFIASVPSFAFVATPGQAVADVEATNGAYTDFVFGDGTFGEIDHDLVPAPPFNEDGNVITLADLFAAGTNIDVLGDFTAANDVFLDGNSADTLSNTAATFIIGNSDVHGDLFYDADLATPILESLYTATLDVSANPGFTIADVGPLAAGEIIRNGTQLQAPLAQVPAGYISRMVLTNTGNVARPYEISVQGETGNTIGTANLTGNVPANGTIVVDLTTVLTSFTGAPRATLNVTVAAPNNQIQGLYQITNPAAGSVSNHIMVRPGTN